MNSLTLKRTTTSRSQLIGLILLSLLTSGCQHLGIFSNDAEPVAINAGREVLTTSTELDDSHEFQLADDQNMIGLIAAVKTRKDDTLSDIARHYGLGYNDISIANPSVPPWTPPVNSRVILPLQFILPNEPHKGIILNLANMRLFYYPKNQPDTVFTYPVGIGRQGWNTPMGLTSIVDKKANPIWVVPDSIHKEHEDKGDMLPGVVPAGPNNP